MFYRYRYEAEIDPGLSRIPLDVRMKLDMTGAKASLKTWQAFSIEERWVLCHLPAESQEEREVFANYLDFLSRKYLGQPALGGTPLAIRPWENLNKIPDSVLEKNTVASEAVTLQEWSRWNSHQRYALYKISISKNEPEQFVAVLEELRKPRA